MTIATHSIQIDVLTDAVGCTDRKLYVFPVFYRLAKMNTMNHYRSRTVVQCSRIDTFHFVSIY